MIFNDHVHPKDLKDTFTFKNIHTTAITPSTTHIQIETVTQQLSTD